MDYQIYLDFVLQKDSTNILENDIFKEYKQAFESLTETKNRKKKTYYKKLTKEEQKEIEDKEFYTFVVENEKQKVYIFALCLDNPQKVVITKAPSENNKNKKFLGYEWSSSKGNEGIKYFADTKTNIDIDTEEIDETDKQAIENIQNINRIITPLYNPKDIKRPQQNKLSYKR